MVRLPKPFQHQREILNSDARFKVVVCGRRWGKTALGLMAVLLGHGSDGRFRGALSGGKVWWVAPSYGIAQELWLDLCRACAPVMLRKSEVLMRIDLPGGGSVRIRSAENPQSLVAVGLDGVVIDEAGIVDGLAWRESLRPALSDRLGWAIFIGTPKGYNWFHDLFVTAGGDDAAQWQRWQRPTSDNPIIQPAEIADAKLTMGIRLFAQEYQANFIGIEGAEFDPSYFDETIWLERWPDDAELWLRVVALDPSKGKTDKSDYSAFVKLALGRDGTMYCEAELERCDCRQVVDRGLEIGRQFRPDAFGIETNQFQEVLANNLADRSKQVGFMLPIWTLDNRLNKNVRIRSTLTPYLARKEIKFLRTRGTRLLVEQLQAFPVADYDDGPDALEMAVRLVRSLYEGAADATGSAETAVVAE